MRLALLVLALAACGGKTSGLTDDTGSTPRPAPGTLACDGPPGVDNGDAPVAPTCTMCSDGEWHCAGQDGGIAACASDDCEATEAKCVSCSGSGGSLCNGTLNPGGDNDVVTTQTTVTCSQ